MKHATTVAELPTKPAVYALYGGRGRSFHVAYVGVTGNLRNRLTQHLERRDSSVSTGVSAAGLNPDNVTEARWWQRGDFRTRYIREAAEIVAFDVLDPALRSRGSIQDKAHDRAAEPAFRSEMITLFEDDPTGVMVIPTLRQALDRIAKLEMRVAMVEKRLPKRD